MGGEVTDYSERERGREGGGGRRERGGGEGGREIDR